MCPALASKAVKAAIWPSKTIRSGLGAKDVMDPTHIGEDAPN